MSFNITYIGHAGFLIEAGHTKILCDPWFYSALYGSWAPYPYNRHLLPHLEKVKPTHIYLSHAHEDHCDIKFLKTIEDSVCIIAPNFEDKEMQKILNFKNNVIFLKNKEFLKIDQVNIQMYLDITTGKNDSAAVFDIDNFKILDINDCYLEQDNIPKCDMLMAQFSGAIHYPHCYDFSDKIKQSKVDEFKNRAFKELQAKIKGSQCSYFVPSAGPPCFLDKEQEHFNDPYKNIFYPWSHFEDRFAKEFEHVKVLSMKPGDEYKNCILIKENSYNISLEDYREETKDERLDDYNKEIINKNDLEKYFGLVRTNHLHVLKLQSKSFCLKILEKEYIINLSSMIQTVYDKIDAPEWLFVNYTIDVPTVLMKDIISGGAWDVSLASGRVKLHRNEDVYDTILFKILYNDIYPEKTKYLVDVLNGNVEMAEVGNLSFQRYCPHAGADMKNANIIDGIIECPRHNWKWDTNNGECIYGGSVKLKCYKKQ